MSQKLVGEKLLCQLSCHNHIHILAETFAYYIGKSKHTFRILLAPLCIKRYYLRLQMQFFLCRRKDIKKVIKPICNRYIVTDRVHEIRVSSIAKCCVCVCVWEKWKGFEKSSNISTSMTKIWHKNYDVY